MSSFTLFHMPFEFHYSKKTFTLSDPNGCFGVLELVDYSKLILQVQTDEESYNLVDLFKTMLLLFYEQSNRVDTQFPEQFELTLLVLHLDYYLWFKTLWF